MEALVKNVSPISRRVISNGVELYVEEFGVDPVDPYLTASPDEIEAITRNAADLYRQNTLRRFQPPKKKSITIPVQLIVPTQDFAIRPEIHEFVGNYVSMLTTRSIVANHWVHRTNAKTINSWLEMFIKNCESEKKSEKVCVNERY